MAAYVIANIEVIDPAGYEEYRRLAGPSVAAFGGEFLVRGGAVTTKEGESPWHRVVVTRFPDMATAQAWYDSPDYRHARGIRERTSRGELILVEGI